MFKCCNRTIEVNSDCQYDCYIVIFVKIHQKWNFRQKLKFMNTIVISSDTVWNFHLSTPFLIFMFCLWRIFWCFANYALWSLLLSRKGLQLGVDSDCTIKLVAESAPQLILEKRKRKLKKLNRKLKNNARVNWKQYTDIYMYIVYYAVARGLPRLHLVRPEHCDGRILFSLLQVWRPIWLWR